MFCNNCGTQLEDGSVFCSNCGCQVGAPQVNAPVNNGYANTYVNPAYAQPMIGMTWAHILSYGFLWVAAFFNLIFSICYITGSIEIEDVPMRYYYAYYGDSLSVADKFYGILGLCLVALEVVVAVFILSYKKNTGNLIFAYYLIRALSISFGEAGAFVPIVAAFLPNIVLTIAGVWLYYKKVYTIS